MGDNDFLINPLSEYTEQSTEPSSGICDDQNHEQSLSDPSIAVDNLNDPLNHQFVLQDALSKEAKEDVKVKVREIKGFGDYIHDGASYLYDGALYAKDTVAWLAKNLPSVDMTGGLGGTSGDSASGGSGGGDDDDDDDDINKLIQDAIDGGKNNGEYKEALGKSESSIKETIKSFDKRILEHQDKIRNPEKIYNTDNQNTNPPKLRWENMSEDYKNRVINHWQKEVTNFKVQKGLNQRVLMERKPDL